MVGLLRDDVISLANGLTINRTIIRRSEMIQLTAADAAADATVDAAVALFTETSSGDIKHDASRCNDNKKCTHILTVLTLKD